VPISPAARPPPSGVARLTREPTTLPRRRPRRPLRPAGHVKSSRERSTSDEMRVEDGLIYSSSPPPPPPPPLGRSGVRLSAEAARSGLPADRTRRARLPEAPTRAQRGHERGGEGQPARQARAAGRRLLGLLLSTMGWPCADRRGQYPLARPDAHALDQQHRPCRPPGCSGSARPRWRASPGGSARWPPTTTSSPSTPSPPSQQPPLPSSTSLSTSPFYLPRSAMHNTQAACRTAKRTKTLQQRKVRRPPASA